MRTGSRVGYGPVLSRPAGTSESRGRIFRRLGASRRRRNSGGDQTTEDRSMMHFPLRRLYRKVCRALRAVASQGAPSQVKNFLLSLLLLISLTVAAAAAGATNISVRVIDSKNGAILNATVSLVSRDGDRRTLTTDSSGSCRFPAIVPGQYFVQGAAAGFQASQPKLIDLEGEGNIDVTLSLVLAPLQTSIVVTASGTPQTTDEVSKALTFVERSEEHTSELQSPM